MAREHLWRESLGLFLFVLLVVISLPECVRVT